MNAIHELQTKFTHESVKRTLHTNGIFTRILFNLVNFIN